MTAFAEFFASSFLVEFGVRSKLTKLMRVFHAVPVNILSHDMFGLMFRKKHVILRTNIRVNSYRPKPGFGQARKALCGDARGCISQALLPPGIFRRSRKPVVKYAAGRHSNTPLMPAAGINVT